MDCLPQEIKTEDKGKLFNVTVDPAYVYAMQISKLNQTFTHILCVVEINGLSSDGPFDCIEWEINENWFCRFME